MENKNKKQMKNIYYLLISMLIFISCQKQGTYECVCYSNENPNNYIKQNVTNSEANAYTYCKLLSNSVQNCFITE